MRVRIAGLEKEQALTDERARIARDMHDAVGARLTQISLLQDMALAEPDIPAPAREKLLHASAGTQEALMAMDEIVWSINPHNDTLRELASYLAHTLREYLEPLNISCRLDIADNLPDHTVHAHVRHALLLMVKEGLQNIAKHAHATQVTLQIEMAATDFCIRIKDDGVGMPAAISTEGGHDGLRNLQERIASLGGSLKLQPGAVNGTEITIAIPLNCLS
jgi:signal transduction histidine kinase